ncbi:hypothetical protein MUN82_09970 [Hymenobacter aerilatus]|uniref:PD-(D/E)XK nuclease superfamily protein n=1 Tax=Hymenobacter aerilatus TaxID=2932251 RepID=A0A8T9SZV4_9BACT|nr:hypothetical protein [Hymenobacter aerilatus]UOR07405.1 hypothetical protein MUN82_09970 [Hymenobacter aerilatus]
MNTHLNLFRHYSASEDQQVLENNLTRALALCLQHDTLFLYTLLGAIVGEEKLRSDLHLTDADERLIIDVQQSVNDLGTCNALYPVALTEAKLDGASYDTIVSWRNDSPITDFVIRYKDVLVLVEVKRTNENCLAQLKGQVEAYQESQGDDPITIMPVTTLSWAQIVRLATNTRNLHQLTGHASPYTTDLVQFIQYHYPHWDEVLPFRSIPFTQRNGAINEAALYKRLHYIQQQAFGEKLMWLNGRVAMPITVKWASEVITYPELSGDKPYISVNVWPGNTKGQGWSLYNRPLDWTTQQTLEVNGHSYPLWIRQYIKFSHFNRYIFELSLEGELALYARNFQSEQAFHKYAGKWKRPRWTEFEQLLDEDTNGEWRLQKSGWQAWEDSFVHTARNYTDVALGFQLSVMLPYEALQQQDSNTENWQPVAHTLQAVIQALQELIDGPTNA